MLGLRFGSVSVSTLLLAMGCGARATGPEPSDTGEPAVANSSEASASTSESQNSDTDPATEGGTSTTIPASTQTSPADVTGAETSAQTADSDDITQPAESSEPDVVSDGGQPLPPVVPPTTPPLEPMCADQCGNDVVDSCEICLFPGGPTQVGTEPVMPLLNLAAPPVETCTTVYEQCDGELTAEQSCAALGFSGGTLACNGACYYDDTSCESCATDPSIVSCRDDLAAGSLPTYVALASNSTDLVAVWNEGCALQMGWFDSTLEQLRSTKLVNAPCLATGENVAVAPLTTGWVVDVGTKRYFVDAAGATTRSLDLAGTALFAASGTATAPLLVRQEAYGMVSATLLDEAGEEVWKTTVSEDVIEAQFGSAAAAGDGFLVTLRTQAGVQVFQLDQETGVIVNTSTPGSASTESPQIAAAGGEVRLVWADFGTTPSVHWAKLDATGQRLGEELTIGQAPDFFNRSPIVVDGTDTVVLFGGYTGSVGVGRATHLRRVDTSGATSAGDIAIQADPNLIQSPQVVAFDGGFVTAWVGKGSAGRVGLAKVSL